MDKKKDQSKKGLLMLTTLILAVVFMFGIQGARATTLTMTAVSADTDADGTVDQITITFSKAVKIVDGVSEEGLASIALDSNCVIANADYASASTTTLVLSGLTGCPAGDTALTPTVTYKAVADCTTAGAICGADNLQMADDTSAISADGAQPIILTAKDQSGTSLDDGKDIPIDANILITFSEPMNTDSLDNVTKWTISSNSENWLMEWDDSKKILTLSHTNSFAKGDIETVTLAEPLAVSGATDADKVLNNAPIATAVANPFTFTIIGETDNDEDEDEDNDGDNDECDKDADDITPPDEAVAGPSTPNCNSGVTLYRMLGDYRVYAIKNKKKHWIKTAKEFEDNGYNWQKIQEVSASILAKYPDAEEAITELLRAIGDTRVYHISNGKKQWIRTAEEFIAAGYNWDKIKDVPAETLATYQDETTSNLLRVKGDTRVYHISNGKKQWIRTAEEFIAAGYDWNDIKEVLSQTLESYPDSELKDAIIQIINTPALRVRSADSTASEILGSVKNLETYQILDKKNGWYKIKMKSGKTGWISGFYAKEK
ncbi:SH3 domain-containing protein [Patescibacteria group bacterium]|nr:SH3 domain-containing protein [Patescibacteria group bacterium]